MEQKVKEILDGFRSEIAGPIRDEKILIESHSSRGSFLFAPAVSLLFQLKLTMRDS